MVEKAYKYRVYPNKEQIELLEKSFGCARFVYNHFLDLKQTAYKEDKTTISYNETSKMLTALKKENTWLKEPDKCALQNSLKDLDYAFKRFFKGAGYPKYKSKHKSRCSYRSSCSRNTIELLDGFIKLPKLGKVKIKDRNYRPSTGRIVNATITKTKTGKYFVSLCYIEVVINPLPKTNKQVGLDLGLKSFLSTSDGDIIQNPRYFEKTLTEKQRHKSTCSKSVSF